MRSWGVRPCDTRLGGASLCISLCRDVPPFILALLLESCIILGGCGADVSGSGAANNSCATENRTISTLSVHIHGHGRVIGRLGYHSGSPTRLEFTAQLTQLPKSAIVGSNQYELFRFPDFPGLSVRIISESCIATGKGISANELSLSSL